MVTEFLKKTKDGLASHFWLVLLTSFIFFLIFFIGQMIAVVGSKQIVEPVEIIAVDSNQSTPLSFKAYMQLARAGNYEMITTQPGQPEGQLKVGGAFIKKLLVSISKPDLEVLESLRVMIGDKSFLFKRDDIRRWEMVDPLLLKSYLYGQNEDGVLVFQMPAEVSLERSAVPVYQNFFKSLINWSGDFVIIKKSLIGAIGLEILFVLSALMIFIQFSKINPSSQVDVQNSQLVRQQYINIFLCVILFVISLTIVNLLIALFYHPNESLLLQKVADSYLPYLLGRFLPKQVERMQFVVDVLIAPGLLYFFYVWLSKSSTFLRKMASEYYNIFVILSSLMIVCLVYFGLAMNGFFFISDSYFFGYYGRFIYSLLFFPLLLHFLIIKGREYRILNYLLVFLIGIALLTIFFMNIIKLDDNFSAANFDPVLYPVSQVAVGKHMLVDLGGLYGLYPFFLAPIFEMFDLTVLSFSQLMAVLVLFSFIFLFLFMHRIIKNRLILYSGFLSVIFYSMLATRTAPDIYYQYWPIRLLFPALGLFLVSLYFESRNKILYFLSFIIYSIGVLWNFDVGLVVLLSWVGVLIFNELSSSDSQKKKIFEIGKHIFFFLFALLLVVLSFVLLTYASSGAMPDYNIFFQYQKMFMMGYYNIALVPPPHTWNILIIIYVVGLLIAISAFYNKKIGYKEKIIFFLSILGIGLFSYYEGQASYLTLFRISYPALLLLVVFCNTLLESFRENGFLSRGQLIIFIFLTFFILSTPFSLVINMNKYFNLINHGISAHNVGVSKYSVNIDFIKSRTTPGENVLIISSLDQSVYYAESKTRSVIDVPSINDFVFPGELNTLINFLKNNKNVKVFVSSPLSAYDIFSEEIREIIKERYVEISKSGDGLSLYKVK